MCQAEDGIRYLVRSRGLGDVYKRQSQAYDVLSDPEKKRQFDMGADPYASGAAFNGAGFLSLIHI